MADDGYKRWARNPETGEPIPPWAQPDTYPYPRGGMRLERGEPEPWEVEEERHAWEASVAIGSGTSLPRSGSRSPH